MFRALAPWRNPSAAREAPSTARMLRALAPWRNPGPAHEALSTARMFRALAPRRNPSAAREAPSTGRMFRALRRHGAIPARRTRCCQPPECSAHWRHGAIPARRARRCQPAVVHGATRSPTPGPARRLARPASRRAAWHAINPPWSSRSSTGKSCARGAVNRPSFMARRDPRRPDRLAVSRALPRGAPLGMR